MSSSLHNRSQNYQCFQNTEHVTYRMWWMTITDVLFYADSLKKCHGQKTPTLFTTANGRLRLYQGRWGCFICFWDPMSNFETSSLYFSNHGKETFYGNMKPICDFLAQKLVLYLLLYRDRCFLACQSLLLRLYFTFALSVIYHTYYDQIIRWKFTAFI